MAPAHGDNKVVCMDSLSSFLSVYMGSIPFISFINIKVV